MALRFATPYGSAYPPIRASSKIDVPYARLEAAETVDPDAGLEGQMSEWIINLLEIVFTKHDDRVAVQDFMGKWVGAACMATFGQDPLTPEQVRTIQRHLSHAIDAHYDIGWRAGVQQVENATRAIIASFE